MAGLQNSDNRFKTVHYKEQKIFVFAFLYSPNFL
jgi:hypothetical protein